MNRSIKLFVALLLVIASTVAMLPFVCAAEEIVDTPNAEETQSSETGETGEENHLPSTRSATMVLQKDYALVKTNTYEYDANWGYETDNIWYTAPNGMLDYRNGLWLHLVQPLGSDTWHMAYCIEPGIQLINDLYGENASYNEMRILLEELLDYAEKPKYLSDDQLRTIALTILYGEQDVPAVGDFENLADWAATQILIWEFAQGYRKDTAPYTLVDDIFYRRFSDYRTGGGYAGSYTGCTTVFGTDYSTGTWGNTYGIQGKIDALVEKLINHNMMLQLQDASGKIVEPSRANDGSVPTIALTPKADGTYSAILTDISGTLDQYIFENTDTVKFAISGNQLIITATGAVDSVVFQPYRRMPTLSDEVFYLWYYEDAQNLMSCVTQPTNDPVPAYFKVQTPTGDMRIIKGTEDGINLSGWQFEIYTDASCTNLISGPHITDSSGNISVAGLAVGTVWVKEVGHSDTAINALYRCDSTNPQQVTITAGGTSIVSFYNKLNYGTAKIIKTTTNGGTVADWHFTVKNSSGTVVGNYVTDATGIITLDLEPGTYSVTETDGEYKYWVNDPAPTKTVVVKAGQTAKVTFQNQWRGQAQIVKTATNGGSVSGWHFTVKNSSGMVVENYVTDATGVITLDLEPGTYTVTETDGAKKYWVNDPTPTKPVTVKAGETAKVTFSNQWRGQAQIVKTATNGGSVAGWHFEVKDSGGTVVGNYVTDATGIITLDLEPGTYTVTETDGVKKYWVNDPTSTKTVTVKAGETAKVTFQNQWVGKAEIVKTTTNGGTVEGWEFTITDADGNSVGTYTTDAAGTILVDLNPGTYTVQETDRNDPYWNCDTAPMTVTVKAGETASVTFQNQWIGKVKIIKTLANPEAGTVEGWKFTITDANGSKLGTYQTDSTGTILVDLEPGTYTVKEVLEDSSLWQCTNENPQTITVEAGKTAEVTFTNALRPGEITIQKVNHEGAPLAGAEFLLEWSEDGINWHSVTYTDAAVVSKGTCSSVGLQDGKLVSGVNGLVVFTGLYPRLQYRLTETEAPDGYQLLASCAYEGVLPVDGNLTVSLTVVNIPVFELPETGAHDAVLLPISVTLCLCLCAGLVIYLRKQ